LTLKLKAKEEKKFTTENMEKKLRDLRIHNINNEKIIIRKPESQEIMNTCLYYNLS